MTEENSTPILTVDESLTTEERLTDNAVNNILPARYLSDGESPDDMFWRVAENVAMAERNYFDETVPENYETEQKWADEFYNLMSTLRFTPNSPTLMNAGEDLQQLSACFVLEVGDSMAEPDEFGRESIFDSAKSAGQIFKCLTEDSRVYVEGKGYVPISSVETGDSIIQKSDSGQVSKTHKYSNADVLTVKLENGIELTGTPNHKLFSDGEEKRIDELEQEDTIDLSLDWISADTNLVQLESVPETLWQTNKNPELHQAIINGVENEKSDYEIAESVPQSVSTVQRHRRDVLDIEPVNNSGGKYQGGYTNKKENGLNSIVQPDTLTEDMAWMLGMWVGDGSYHEDGIRFHNSEDHIVNKISSISEQLFNIQTSTYQDGSCYEVGLYSSALKRYWQQNFGEGKPNGAHSASVPEYIYQSPRNVVISFIRGLYDADGTIIRNRHPSLTTVSNELAKGIQQLLHGIGIPSNIWVGDNNYQVRPNKDGIDRFLDVIGANKSYELDDIHGDTSPVKTYSSKVSSVEDSGTNTVYDITIEGKHEYIASSVHSHNSGGGVGYTFGFLRPKGAHIESTDSETSGPMEFMRLFDEVCNTVKQGGKRRGAQMAIMPVTHPDIARFVTAKRNEGEYSNFNISVGLTDEFIKAVREDDTYILKDPQTEHKENFEILQATKNFFSVSQADAPHATVDENIWRDYADDIDAWHWENDKTVSFSDKWEAHFKQAEEGGNLDVGEEMALPARFIWDMIIDGAWRNGEPGLFYLDETNREHTFDTEKHPEYEIHATNPCAEQPLNDYEACLTGDQLVLTEDGVRRIDSFKDGSMVATDNDITQVGSEAKLIPQGERSVVNVEIEGGMEITCTPDHEFMTDSGAIEAKDLAKSDAKIRWMENNPLSNPVDMSKDGAKTAFTIGWMHGDGWLTENTLGISFNNEDGDFEIKDWVLDEYHNLFGERKPLKDDNVSYQEQTNSNAAFKIADEYGFNYGMATERTLPDCFYNWGENKQLSFIRGLFTADSEIGGKANNQIKYATSSYELADELQSVLGSFGIQSRKYVNERSNRHDQIQVRITKDSARLFIDYIGYETSKKYDMFDRSGRQYTDSNLLDVISVTEAGTEQVYDLNVPETNVFFTNGALVHNCNLGHINLSLMVKEGATEYGKWRENQDHNYYNDSSAVVDYLNESVDYDELDRVIEGGVRFLDNVIDMSEFPLDNIEDTVTDMRKIGLGVMGWAQMLCQLGIPYGSDESYAAAKHIMSYIDARATRESHKLAQERGAFEAWEDSKYADPTEYSDWFKSHAYVSPSDFEDGYLMRNHNVTTVAPTGCVSESSLISTSNGLETINDMGSTNALEQWDDINRSVVTDDGMKNCTSFYDAGMTNVKTITSSHGLKISATPNHKLRTVSDGEIVWKESRDFEEGDIIVGMRNTFVGSDNETLDTSEAEKFHQNSNDNLILPERMTVELAEFLGYWMGDEYTDDDDVGVKMVVDTSNDEIIEYITELGESVFGVSPAVEDKGTRAILSFGGRHLPRYFEDNGWTKDNGNQGEGAASAFVPQQVRQSSEGVAKAFIRGLFEADGCASNKIELSTVSEQLSVEVQSLLLSLGHLFQRNSMAANELGDNHYGDRTRYTLRGANNYEDKKFLNKIGFFTKNTNIELSSQSYRNDVIPNSLLDTSSSGSNSAEEDYVFGTVSSVEDSVAYTKDISVPDNKTYVANGFISHNTTSMVADTSGGIEPIYNVAYKKNVGDDIQGAEKLVEFDSYFLRTLEENGINVSDVKEEAAELMDSNSFESVKDLETVPEELAEIFVTSEELSSRQHGLMQRAFQHAVDSGISKTINLPNEATHSDVHDAYMLALDDDEIGAPIKGLTVYRDGSREEQVLMTGEETDAALKEAKEKLEQAGFEVVDPGGDSE